MANHKGSEGTVHIGTAAIAELRSWEFDEEVNTIDDTVLNDTADTHKAGTTRWSGRASAFWDATDTNGQEAIKVGTAVTLRMYPEGTGTGAVFYHGTATPTRVSRRATGPNSMVEVDFDFLGNGAVAQTTV